jgi:hypothetical protein
MMPLSAAVFPNYAHAKSMVCQDWKTWLEKGWFDFISPMAYYHDAQKVRQSYEETEALVNTNAFNLQGLSSIINDGNYQTHYEQMALINERGGLGSILFSIRQFVKDQYTFEMVRYLNKKHPAISPLEPLEDIIRFMAPPISERLNESLHPAVREMSCLTFTSELGYQQFFTLLASLTKATVSLNDQFLNGMIDALQKTVRIRYNRFIKNNHERNETNDCRKSKD